MPHGVKKNAVKRTEEESYLKTLERSKAQYQKRKEDGTAKDFNAAAYQKLKAAGKPAAYQKKRTEYGTAKDFNAAVYQKLKAAGKANLNQEKRNIKRSASWKNRYRRKGKAAKPMQTPACIYT
jgi:hypothetical protein